MAGASGLSRDISMMQIYVAQLFRRAAFFMALSSLGCVGARTANRPSTGQVQEREDELLSEESLSAPMAPLDVGPYLIPLEEVAPTVPSPRIEKANPGPAAKPNASVANQTWSTIIQQSDPFLGSVEYVFRPETLTTPGGRDAINWTVRDTTRVTLTRELSGAETATFQPPVTLGLVGHKHVHALVSAIRQTDKLATVTMRSSFGAHMPEFRKRFLRAVIRTLAVSDKNAALDGIPFASLRASTPPNAGAALIAETSLGSGVHLHAPHVQLTLEQQTVRFTGDYAA
jgi:hypothetical protein